jgi:imidazole glycerol phosphate synthase glutamine amidotransferase subunit
VIGVIDYGAGNLRSVTNVLDVLDARYCIVADGTALEHVDKVVLPGVGHFGQLASAMDARALREPLTAMLNSGVPYLGICLGMQILFASSTEAPEAIGLGALVGEVRRIEGAERLPHMGWNTVQRTATSVLLATDQTFFYFANGYACPVVEGTVGICEYGSTFSAVVEREGIFGVQFHPEKSGTAGRAVIERFVGV